MALIQKPMRYPPEEQGWSLSDMTPYTGDPMGRRPDLSEEERGEAVLPGVGGGVAFAPETVSQPPPIPPIVDYGPEPASVYQGLDPSGDAWGEHMDGIRREAIEEREAPAPRKFADRYDPAYGGVFDDREGAELSPTLMAKVGLGDKSGADSTQEWMKFLQANYKGNPKGIRKFLKGVTVAMDGGYKHSQKITFDTTGEKDYVTIDTKLLKGKTGSKEWGEQVLSKLELIGQWEEYSKPTPIPTEPTEETIAEVDNQLTSLRKPQFRPPFLREGEYKDLDEDIYRGKEWVGKIEKGAQLSKVIQAGEDYKGVRSTVLEDVIETIIDEEGTLNKVHVDLKTYRHSEKNHLLPEASALQYNIGYGVKLEWDSFPEHIQKSIQNAADTYIAKLDASKLAGYKDLRQSVKKQRDHSVYKGYIKAIEKAAHVYIKSDQKISDWAMRGHLAEKIDRIVKSVERTGMPMDHAFLEKNGDYLEALIKYGYNSGNIGSTVRNFMKGTGKLSNGNTAESYKDNEEKALQIILEIGSGSSIRGQMGALIMRRIKEARSALKGNKKLLDGYNKFIGTKEQQAQFVARLLKQHWKVNQLYARSGRRTVINKASAALSRRGFRFEGDLKRGKNKILSDLKRFLTNPRWGIRSKWALVNEDGTDMSMGEIIDYLQTEATDNFLSKDGKITKRSSTDMDRRRKEDGAFFFTHGHQGSNAKEWREWATRKLDDVARNVKVQVPGERMRRQVVRGERGAQQGNTHKLVAASRNLRRTGGGDKIGLLRKGDNVEVIDSRVTKNKEGLRVVFLQVRYGDKVGWIERRITGKGAEGVDKAKRELVEEIPTPKAEVKKSKVKPKEYVNVGKEINFRSSPTTRKKNILVSRRNMTTGKAELHGYSKDREWMNISKEIDGKMVKGWVHIKVGKVKALSK